ncbi:MAG: hypothetical protein Q9216_001533 [Gyalolechia sp. 2 TL-2023]
MGRSSDAGWESETIDLVGGVEGSVMASGGHFVRQIPHVNLLPSTRISSSQGSGTAPKGQKNSLPARLTLRPNEINELQIGGYRLFITPFLRPTCDFLFNDLDSRYQDWQNLFPSPDSFWYCGHCERSATRVAVAKLAPVACELSACEKEDLKDFIRRRECLEPLGSDNRCLERILAIYDGNNGSETPLVVSSLNMTAVTFEQKLVEKKSFKIGDIKDMLEELLTALALHDIEHGGISKSTIFVDDNGRVYLRGFMKPANLRRLGQDVQDLFEVFRSLTPCYPDFRFYKYLSQPFDSVEHARNHFPLPDATFDEISWTRYNRVYEEIPNHAPALTYIAIGQLCDMLLLEEPSEAASYINILGDLHRSPRLGADFDHCTLHDFKKAFPALSHRRLPRTWYGRVPILKLAGYGTFIECSRLRLWAGRECVDHFDRTYADYPFLDVVSHEGSLNGSHAAVRDVPDIVECLNLPKDLFSSVARQGEDTARIPRFLYHLQTTSISLTEASNGEISWSTSDVGKPSIQRSGFAKLLQRKHEYPHIFKIIPRVLLDDFKSTITRDPPVRPEVDEVPSFRFKNRRKASLPQAE